MLRVLRDVDRANGYVFGSDEERTLAALAGTAADNAEFTDERIAHVREKHMDTSSDVLVSQDEDMDDVT